jgi:hypothetical protein
MTYTRRDPEVRERARILHHCPENYDGPCWGPTDGDYKQAIAELEAERSH